MKTARSLIIALAAMLAFSLGLFAQESRTWTATSGHKTEATLVDYTTAEIQLRLGTGKTVTVPMEKFSSEDRAYLKKFPKLKKRARPKDMPELKLRVQRKGNKSFKGGGYRVFQMSVTNLDDEPISAELFFTSFVEYEKTEAFDAEKDAPPTEEEKKKEGKFAGLVSQGARRQRMRLLAEDTVSRETPDIKSSQSSLTGDDATGGGTKVHGFVVQLYWDGWLLQHYTSSNSLLELAKDDQLPAKVRRGEFNYRP